MRKFWDILTTLAGVTAAAATAINAIHPSTTGTIIQAGAIGVLGYGSNKVRMEPAEPTAQASTQGQ